MREYTKMEDKPKELVDHSDETLEEYRNRVFLMYLTTLLAELRLHTNVFLNDAHPLYPGYEPNPQILVDFKPSTEEEGKMFNQLCRAATVKFQSTPFDCEWLAFDAFSDKMGYSVHHKWATVELRLKKGTLQLHYQDSFEHEDPNFGPFGLAQRVLQVVPENEEVAELLGLPKEKSVVSQVFKECHSYDHFRYFINSSFYRKLGAELGWEDCTVSQMCNLLSLMITQTHRRVHSALLPNSYGVLQMEEFLTDTIERLKENLEMVYPSKHPEGTRAELLAEQAREKLQTLCKLSSVAKMAQVDCMRRKLQQDYDTLLLAATEPGMRPPPFMQPQQMGQNVHFNPALNQMYLNSFHNSPFGFGYSHPYPPPGYPSHPYPPPPSYGYDSYDMPWPGGGGGPGMNHGWKRDMAGEGGKGGRGGYGGGKGRRGQGGRWGGRMTGKGKGEGKGDASKAAKEDQGSQKGPNEDNRPAQNAASKTPMAKSNAPSRNSKKDKPQMPQPGSPRTPKTPPKSPKQTPEKKAGAQEKTRRPKATADSGTASSAKGGKRKWRPLHEVL
jgi:hypothetical protein